MKVFGLKKTYESRVVLDVPQIEFADGAINAILGANGSGKSTLAKLIARIEQPDDGAALRVEPSPGSPLRSGAMNIGYLPQQSYAFRMSLKRNIALNAQSEQEQARVDLLMQRLNLSHLAEKRGKQLSGGETARMALARLLVHDYDVIVLDEPTAATDEESTLVIEELLRDYVRRTGATALIITHELKQAMRIADAVYYLEKGALVECGPAGEFFENARDERTRAFINFYRI